MEQMIVIACNHLVKIIELVDEVKNYVVYIKYPSIANDI
ncbi:hypothetical protein HNR33_000079 [Brassicibacter mesophilus]